jgi:hypothetical protein
MRMTLIVLTAGVRRRARLGINGTDANGTLVRMTSMRVMHMAIVQIIGVIAMLNARVTTTGSVLMIVILMFFVIVHGMLLC